MAWEDVTFLKRKGARACSKFQSGIKLIFLRFIWYLFECSGSIWVVWTETYYWEKSLWEDLFQLLVHRDGRKFFNKEALLGIFWSIRLEMVRGSLCSIIIGMRIGLCSWSMEAESSMTQLATLQKISLNSHWIIFGVGLLTRQSLWWWIWHSVEWQPAANKKKNIVAKTQGELFVKWSILLTGWG